MGIDFSMFALIVLERTSKVPGIGGVKPEQ
jgi:hypothetical protein